MKTQRLALVLTVVNLMLQVFILLRLRPDATAQGVAPVLRGRALEIVDDNGKVRSQIIVVPPTTMPDGKKYPETTLFRLIDPNGRPSVRLGDDPAGRLGTQGMERRANPGGRHGPLREIDKPGWPRATAQAVAV